MKTEKNTEHTEEIDSAAYGGSRYRLSYDKLQKKPSETVKKDYTTRIGIVLIVVSVFAAIGLLIVRYYGTSLSQIFSKGNPSDTSSGFHSYESVSDDAA